MSEGTLLPPEDGPPVGLLDHHVESFLKHLRAARYADRTRRNKRPIARSFVRWTRRHRVAIKDLNESHVDSFVKRSPRRRKARVRFELAVLRLFLQYLRLEAGVPILPPRKESSPTSALYERYLDFLRNERGLAENSISVYSPYIYDFLTEQKAVSDSAPRDWDAQSIQDFLLDRVQGRSSEWSRLLAAALRSFLRFLHEKGATASKVGWIRLIRG